MAEQHTGVDKGRPIAAITLSRTFHMIFLSVLGLTVLSLGVSLFLVLYCFDCTPEIKQLLETCSTSWKMGFGAMVGLIGGRALTVEAVVSEGA